MPAESKLCRSVFGKFRDKARKRKDEGGWIYLPEDINGFSGADGRAEMTIKGKKLALQWLDFASSNLHSSKE